MRNIMAVRIKPLSDTSDFWGWLKKISLFWCLSEYDWTHSRSIFVTFLIQDVWRDIANTELDNLYDLSLY